MHSVRDECGLILVCQEILESAVFDHFPKILSGQMYDIGIWHMTVITTYYVYFDFLNV